MMPRHAWTVAGTKLVASGCVGISVVRVTAHVETEVEAKLEVEVDSNSNSR